MVQRTRLSFCVAALVLAPLTVQAQCIYMGGYPWKDGGCVIGPDLNPAIASRNPLIFLKPLASNFLKSFEQGIPAVGRASFTDLQDEKLDALPKPTVAGRGGALTHIAPSNQYVYGLTTAGALVTRAMTFNDINTIDMPKPNTTTLGGVFSYTAPPNNFVNSLDNTGTFGSASFTFADLPPGVATGGMPLPTPATLGGVSLSTLNTGFVTGIATDGAVTKINPPAQVTDFSSGSWTPVDQSGAGLTFTAGSYKKIRALTYVYNSLVFPTTANASVAKVAMQGIGALPFPFDDSARQCSLSYSSSAALAQIQPGASADAANLYFNNSAGVRLTNTQMSGVTLKFMCTLPGGAVSP